MQCLKPFIVCIFLFFSLTISGIAQIPDEWPKLYSSFSEDFSDYNSFPSICFEQALWDESGKMWLVPCSGLRHTGNINLFQFDGYDFRVVEGDWEQIPYGANFKGIYKKHWLAGSLGESHSTHLFFFNLQTGEVKIHDLAAHGYIKQVRIIEGGQLFLFMEKEGSWVFYKWVDEGLVQESKVSIPKGYTFDYVGHNTFLNEEKLILKTSKGHTLFSVNKKTGTTKAFDLNTLPVGDIPLDTVRRKQYENTIIKGMEQDGFFFDQKGKNERLLYHLNPGNETYEKIENIPNEWWLLKIARDESGNTIYVFKDEQNQLKSILIDQEGKYFDYTDLFEKLEGTLVRNIYSRDFKKELIICNGKGILLQRIKLEEAIQTVFSDYSIRAMVELPDQHFIIGTQSGGDLLLQLKDKTYSRFTVPGCFFEEPGLRVAFIKKEDRYIWTCYPDRIVRYDYLENTCVEYNNLEESDLYNMVFTKPNQLVLSHRSSALSIYDLSTQTQKIIRLNTETGNIDRFIQNMVYSEDGFLWLATNNGFFKLDMQTYELTEISQQEGFLDNRFLCIDQDKNGKIWLGSPLGGLHIYDPATGDVQTLNSEDGLRNNTIASIQEDEDGDRWLGTYNGISIVSPEGKLIANLNIEDGLVNKEANRYAHLKTSDGNLLIGTIKGLNWINPRKIKNRLLEEKDLKIYLTSLSYYDINKGENIQQLYHLQHLEAIELPASERNIQLKFALSNYFTPKANQYAYKLEGLNEDWIDIGNQHSLNLQNLPVGKYKLLIKGSNAIGNWTNTPISIPIHAKEYFYKQSWFILLVAFLLIGILVGIAWVWINQLRKQVRLATQEIRNDKKVIEEQAKQLLELDKAKSRFFTNISHEFRTPLTVILGMIRKIKKQPGKWVNEGGIMIERNTENLLNLVNQILDLRKLESGKLELNLFQADVIPHLQYILESFDSLGESKSVRAHFICEEKSVIMDYDPEKLLRVVSNLLSNAIKFTPENGHVYLIVKRTADQLIIQVKDTGIGIPAEKREKIFDQFYQLENTAKWAGHGTGIGLALSKEIVLLMEGAIKVSSELNKGSTFTINLPIRNNARLKEVVEADLPKIDTSYTNEITKDVANELVETVDETSDAPLVLLIDDNRDVLQYVIACLEDKYQLAIARDGQEGINKALELIPDVIVSDVMMPRKNGYEVCDELKTNEKTSHIPIILLTAKASDHSKMEGLQKGADVYLTKPFKEEELLIRLNNIIESRRKTQLYYQQIYASPTSETKPIAPQQEDEFLQKIRTLLINKLDDVDYGIIEICRDAGMSRSQMHRKIKALTGQSTSIFLRRIRLHKAKELLKTTDQNISQVSYNVGINNPSYFARLFTEEFGHTPSETNK
ncbi:MAG: ATP-binding protein [Chitinophagales bacterium]|nr:ATP-binding protein [Chitinophagales bacterium]